jgi:hypothetical protein
VDTKRAASILHAIPPLVSDSGTQTFPVNWNISEVYYFARIKPMSHMYSVAREGLKRYTVSTKDKR